MMGIRIYNPIQYQISSNKMEEAKSNAIRHGSGKHILRVADILYLQRRIGRLFSCAACTMLGATENVTNIIDKGKTNEKQ